MTAAILLNAVYFKAAWASPFSAAETAMKPFNLDPQKKIDVPTMQKRHNYQLAEGDGYRAINLPYAPQGLSMIIVLPDGIGKADEIAKAVDAEGATSLIGRLTRANETFVSLALPKFKTSFGAGLAGALQKEGMLKAFSQKDADFTGMTKDAPKPGLLYISDVLHRATIDVAEEGAEAAAATAVVFGLRSIMPVERPEPVPFIVDRPFLFYLVDDQTNAVLFRGRISNPLL
jgi:serpin B